METENFVETMGAGFSKAASVDNVFGEPIRVGEKTIIPVASVAYGFGGGYGHSVKTQPFEEKTDAFQNPKPKGEGAGGGGGMYSKAKGVYEVTPYSTRFIPANPVRQILMGIAIGFILKSFYFSKRRKN
jgi:uncharacterized spore protein YtfJ